MGRSGEVPFFFIRHARANVVNDNTPPHTSPRSLSVFEDRSCQRLGNPWRAPRSIEDQRSSLGNSRHDCAAAGAGCARRGRARNRRRAALHALCALSCLATYRSAPSAVASASFKACSCSLMAARISAAVAVQCFSTTAMSLSSAARSASICAKTPPPTLCRRTTVLQPIVRLCASAARLVER